MALFSNVLCHQLRQLSVHFFTGKELEQKQATCAEPVPVKAAMPIPAEPEVALLQGSGIDKDLAAFSKNLKKEQAAIHSSIKNANKQTAGQRESTERKQEERRGDSQQAKPGWSLFVQKSPLRMVEENRGLNLTRHELNVQIWQVCSPHWGLGVLGEGGGGGGHGYIFWVKWREQWKIIGMQCTIKMYSVPTSVGTQCTMRLSNRPVLLLLLLFGAVGSSPDFRIPGFFFTTFCM